MSKRRYIEVDDYFCGQYRGVRRIYEGSLSYALLTLDGKGFAAANNKLRRELEKKGCTVK